LLDTDLKIILLDRQNNFVETLKIMSNAAENFDILTIGMKRENGQERVNIGRQQ